MDRFFTYHITDDADEIILLDFLRQKGFSGHILSAMKADKGAIRLNGSRGYGRTLLKKGDLLEIRLLETEFSEKILPVPLDFQILYEDQDLLVVNKPAKMPVHPSQGNYENTLANAVAYYYEQKGEHFVYRCINRLDRDTTGALILAKNALSASLLSVQMKNRQIRRTYLALAQGCIPESGTITAPIARSGDSTIERIVDYEHGESAVTHYQRLDFQNGLSLAELHLETGRTHQIRVHMKQLGHPLPGDFLYNPDFRRILRQALHSYQIEFTHPITGKALLFTAPVPEDFCNAFLTEGDISK